jgi:probable F420-dependent oxidoreductase
MPNKTPATVKVGVQLHPQATTTAAMRQAWKHADAIGVDSLWVWDHFYPLYGDPDATHFEAYTLLAAMAADTTKATIGAMVTCNSYRNPQLLADMARTIDHLSDGRFILGIGSGWFERDYIEYGYEFGTAIGRLHLLRDALPIIAERMSKLNPGPFNGSIPVLIGGGGEKVTLRLVAQYAQMWNGMGEPADIAHKNSVIDKWCTELGRSPAEIERTVLVPPTALEPDQLAAFLDAGADHLVVMSGDPFDLSAVEKFLAAR